MKINYIPNRVIDADGIADGASIYVYYPTTTTLVPLYIDRNFNTPVNNPYIVAAGAAVPALYADTPSVRVKIVTATGMEDYDPYDPLSMENISVVTRLELASLVAPATGDAQLLGDTGREGIFIFDSSNLSASVTTDPQQGVYIAPISDTTGASGAWVRKFSGLINVKWFGAVGNGTVDDTTAIQAALNTGKVVYAPAGTYKITNSLTMTNNYAGLVGDGFQTLIQTNHATADIFILGNGTDPFTGMLFKDFRVWSSVVKTGGYAFNCRKPTNFRWENVYCGSIDSYGGSGSAHRLYKGYKFDNFLECVIDGGQFVTANDCITTSTGAELTVGGGARFYNSGGKAVYLGGASGGVHLERADISLCRYGVYCDNVLTGTTNTELFLHPGLTIDSCLGWGLNIEASGLALLEANGAWIAGCGINGSEGGVRIAPSAGTSARWVGCRIYANIYDGIQISDGYHAFSGGFIKNNGSGAAGGYGLLVGAASLMSVSGVLIHNNGNGTRGYGVWLAGSVDNYSITGNAFSGNGQSPALFINADPGPSANRIIRGNSGLASNYNLFTGDALTFNTAAITDSATGRLLAAGFPALTGDVTTAGGALATTIAATAVTYAKFQNVAGLSVVGRSANSSGVAAAVTGTDGQMLSVKGTTLAFNPTILAKFDHFVDAGNTTTSETDLYSDSIAAAQLAINGDKLRGEYGGLFVAHATATRQVKLYFGGTAIFDTGALATTTAETWLLDVTFIRVSSSVVRYKILFSASTATGGGLSDVIKTGELTGLTLANANTLKITGTAGGVGAATNDIVAKLGTVIFIPAV